MRSSVIAHLLIGSEDRRHPAQGVQMFVDRLAQKRDQTITGKGARKTYPRAGVIDLTSPLIEEQGGLGVRRDLRPQPSRGGGAAGSYTISRSPSVGTDRSYMATSRKVARETDRASGNPYTINPRYQFLEVSGAIAAFKCDGTSSLLFAGCSSPSRADEVAAMLPKLRVRRPEAASSNRRPRNEHRHRNGAKKRKAVGDTRVSGRRA